MLKDQNLDEGLPQQVGETSENHASDGEEEEEFSFDCGGPGGSPISADDIFVDGQIKTVYPLFNRDLFFSVEDLRDSLPPNPPVKNVFVETTRSDRRAVQASAPEICKKSNSTGFSKIWRFKDLLGRSNSDGRDTYVYLNNGHPPPPAAPAEQSGVKLKADEKKKLKDKLKGKVKKGKTAPVSPHEAYLKSKAKEGGQRRSYLPHRPELKGFFTNVSGGLTKNVHPF